MYLASVLSSTSNSALSGISSPFLTTFFQGPPASTRHCTLEAIRRWAWERVVAKPFSTRNKSARINHSPTTSKTKRAALPSNALVGLATKASKNRAAVAFNNGKYWLCKGLALTPQCRPLARRLTQTAWRRLCPNADEPLFHPDASATRKPGPRCSRPAW